MNLYASLGELKRALRVPQAADADRDPPRLLALEAASRRTDRETNRRFYTEHATRVFDGPAGSRTTWFDADLVGEADVTGSGSPLVAGEGYVLWPPNAVQKRGIGFTSAVYCGCYRAVSVTGTWGYSDDVAYLVDLDDAIDAVETDFKTNVADNILTGGETLRIEAEDVYVEHVDSNNIIVRRGINGTTAAAHAEGTPVYRRVFPADIVEAVIMEAARIVRDSETGQSLEVGGDALGGFTAGNFGMVRGIWQSYRVPVTA